MDDSGVVILTPEPRQHQLPCKKCGEQITMTDELYRQMVALKGSPAHATCPTDAAALAASLRTYRVVIEVHRVGREDEGDELLTRAGTTVEAASFVEALPALGQTLATQWDKVVESAPLAELDDDETPADGRD